MPVKMAPQLYFISHMVQMKVGIKLKDILNITETLYPTWFR